MKNIFHRSCVQFSEIARLSLTDVEHCLIVADVIVLLFVTFQLCTWQCSVDTWRLFVYYSLSHQLMQKLTMLGEYMNETFFFAFRSY